MLTCTDYVLVVRMIIVVSAGRQVEWNKIRYSDANEVIPFPRLNLIFNFSSRFLILYFISLFEPYAC